jgi:hypothetical protein
MARSPFKSLKKRWLFGVGEREKSTRSHQQSGRDLGSHLAKTAREK